MLHNTHCESAHGQFSLIFAATLVHVCRQQVLTRHSSHRTASAEEQRYPAWLRLRHGGRSLPKGQQNVGRCTHLKVVDVLNGA